MKYHTDFERGLICLLILVFAFLCNACYGSETTKSYWQNSLFVDFNGTAHNGFDENHGGAVSFGIGDEYIYVVNSHFAGGVVAKTNLNFDAYIENQDEASLIDEYGTWTLTAGGIVYVGDYFFISYNGEYNIKTFHHDTYLSYDDGDKSIKELDYDINNLNYSLTLGYRVNYHLSVYTNITTHIINNELDSNKRQWYLGIKFHI